MALHTELPIHRTGIQLLSLAVKAQEQMPRDQVWQAANSYFGLLRQATHSHADRARLANVIRQRDKAVKADLTKTYPGAAR